MDPGHPLLRAPSLTLTPEGRGAAYTVAVADRAGARLASCDAEGTLRWHTGDVLLLAPVRRHGRRDQPLQVGLDVADAWQRPLGSGRVVKYGFGPRARKVTVALTDAAGAPVGKLEPRDHRGDELALASDAGDLATVAVEHVKTGFLRRARIYRADLTAALQPAARPLVLAALIRYDALLALAADAATSDRR
jgi:hypothetical protein